MEDKQNFFEKRIRPVLLYVGSIVAAVMAIAYVIAVFVLIQGFKASTILNTTIFSIVTAIIGFCIMQMLKIQGQSFAENIPENKELRTAYLNTQPKEKKFKSLLHYWVTSTISDIIVKCVSLAITSIGVVYLVIEGSGNYNMLFLALVNLLMFAGFGMVSLVNTYDFYNESYVPYMKNKIKEAEEKHEQELKKQEQERIRFQQEQDQLAIEIERKKQEYLDMVARQSVYQRDVIMDNNRGINLLESGNNNRNISSVQPLVVDRGNFNNSVLGGPIYSSGSFANSFDICSKQNLPENKIQTPKETERVL